MICYRSRGDRCAVGLGKRVKNPRLQGLCRREHRGLPGERDIPTIPCTAPGKHQLRPNRVPHPSGELLEQGDAGAAAQMLLEHPCAGRGDRENKSPLKKPLLPLQEQGRLLPAENNDLGGFFPDYFVVFELRITPGALQKQALVPAPCEGL